MDEGQWFEPTPKHKLIINLKQEQMKKTHKVVMLPTEKASILAFIENKLFYEIIEFKKAKLDVVKPQHLYIISDDEIKEGDWNLCINNNIIKQYFINGDSKNGLHGNCCRKIVATTDKSLLIHNKCWCMKPEVNGCSECTKQLPQIPESFIQAYIKTYNEGKSITEVDVEYSPIREEVKTGAFKTAIDRPTIWETEMKTVGYTVKTRPDNTVIIHQSKLYTRDEIIKLIHTATDDCCFNPSLLDKWIQDNL